MPEESEAHAARHALPIQQGMHDEMPSKQKSFPGVARLVFGQMPRGVPVLHRGWRTPDPSPTRSAAGLPGCGVKLMLMVTGPCREAEKRAISPGERGHKIRFSRTPSPPTAADLSDLPSGQCTPDFHAWRAASLAQHGDGFQEDGSDSLTASPAAPWKSGGTANVVDGAAGDGLQDALQQQAPEAGEGAAQGAPAMGLQPAALGGFFAWIVPMAQVPVPPPVAYPFAGEGPQPCPPSRGSVGHPHCCAEFCKFAKKPRGCKDGAECDHCHLCTQRRVEVSRGRVDRRRVWRR